MATRSKLNSSSLFKSDTVYFFSDKDDDKEQQDEDREVKIKSSLLVSVNIEAVPNEVALTACFMIVFTSDQPWVHSTLCLL